MIENCFREVQHIRYNVYDIIISPIYHNVLMFEAKRLLPNQSEKCNYNTNLVQFNQIRKWRVRVRPENSIRSGKVREGFKFGNKNKVAYLPSQTLIFTVPDTGLYRHNGWKLRAPLNLSVRYCFDRPRGFRSVFNWAYMIADSRQSLGQL